MRSKKASEKFIGQHFVWRLYQRDDGTFYADGRSNQVDAGRRSLGVSTRSEALRRLPDLDHCMALELGMLESESPNGSSEAGRMLTLAEGRREYEEFIGRSEVLGGTAPSTQKRYRAVLDKFVAFAESKGVATWNGVGDKLITDYAHYLEITPTSRSKRYAPKTIRQELTVLKQCHKWLIEQGLLSNGKSLTVKIRKVEGEPHYCYKPDEVAAMINYCELNNLTWIRNIIVALACTGLRIGELASLRWSAIVDDVSMINLVDERTHASRLGKEARRLKNRTSRKLPIAQDLKKILVELPRSGPYVFRGLRGGRLKPDRVTKRLREYVIKPLASRFPSIDGEKGFENGVCHGFRRFFCSQCANSGVPEQMVMDWLGHTESKMVRHYYSLHERESKRRMAEIDFWGRDVSERFADSTTGDYKEGLTEIDRQCDS